MSVSAALRALSIRGCVSEMTANAGTACDAALATWRRSGVGPRPCTYAGVDATGASLHLGHLQVILSLARMATAGLRPLLLLGGATALVGDPSGRRTERPLLDTSVVASNAIELGKEARALWPRVLAAARRAAVADGGAEDGVAVDTDIVSCADTSLIIVDNAEFYTSLNILDFLRDTGRHARMSAMLVRDSVHGRLSSETGLSFAEFSYQLLQAHDYARLHATEACILQLGGSDQWGNITAGIDLIRRRAATAGKVASAHGLTVPLLTTAAGDKVGKSTGNAPVWLVDDDRTSAFAFYQHLLSTPDEDAPRLLRQLTFLPESEVVSVLAAQAAAPHRKAAQRALADAVTATARGDVAAAAARAAAMALFSDSAAWGAAVRGGGCVGELPRAADLLALATSGDVGALRLPAAEVSSLSLADVLVRAGLSSSRNDARRALVGGGVRINGTRVAAPPPPPDSWFVDGKVALFAIGSRRFLVVLE